MSETEGKKILVVEDDESVVDFLTFAIEREGFSVTVAHDGTSAYATAERVQPDLIILDMMLPGKSGYEILKSLQNYEFKDVPVIVMTGRFSDDSYRNMVEFEPNVKEFMTKPVKTPVLIAKIHQLLDTAGEEDGGISDEQRKLWE